MIGEVFLNHKMIMIFIAIDSNQTMQEMIVQRKYSVLLSTAQDTISS